MRASWSFLEQLYIYFHLISYAKVTIYSQYQVWIRNFIKNQQTIISVIEAIAIYHNIERVNSRAFQQVHILNYHLIFRSC